MSNIYYMNAGKWLSGPHSKAAVEALENFLKGIVERSELDLNHWSWDASVGNRIGISKYLHVDGYGKYFQIHHLIRLGLPNDLCAVLEESLIPLTCGSVNLKLFPVNANPVEIILNLKPETINEWFTTCNFDGITKPFKSVNIIHTDKRDFKKVVSTNLYLNDLDDETVDAVIDRITRFQ